MKSDLNYINSWHVLRTTSRDLWMTPWAKSTLTTWNVSQVDSGKARRYKSTRNWPDYCGMSQNECAPILGRLNFAVCSASPSTSSTPFKKSPFETRLEEIDWLRSRRGAPPFKYSADCSIILQSPSPLPFGAVTNQPNWPSTLNLSRNVKTGGPNHLVGLLRKPVLP